MTMDIDRRAALTVLGGGATSLWRWRRSMAAPAVTDGMPAIRIGVLQFGSVAWQLDVIRQHDLARSEGVRIEVVELASNQATLVALQAGAVDAVVSDLLWVARQRAAGADWCFVPYSSALGAVEVPEASPIRTVDDLPGRRLGIAGTPLDKSWLLLRLLSRRTMPRDLDEAVDKVFGAPPLLAEELLEGRLDAVLTYWQFAARLEAGGARRVIGMSEAMRALGVSAPVPLVGYVLSERWAHEHVDICGGFLRAARRAEEILLRSDEEWQRIGPLTGAKSAAELARLRDAYREGVPRRGDPGMRVAAEVLYELFVQVGGEALVGPSASLPPGTFLDGIEL
jgi:NitT/TauT family transport system substrate-binding protein